MVTMERVEEVNNESKMDKVAVFALTCGLPQRYYGSNHFMKIKLIREIDRYTLTVDIYNNEEVDEEGNSLKNQLIRKYFLLSEDSEREIRDNVKHCQMLMNRGIITSASIISDITSGVDVSIQKGTEIHITVNGITNRDRIFFKFTDVDNIVLR